MKSYILIGRTFFNQTIDFLRVIKEQYPGADTTFLVAARSNTLDQLNGCDDFNQCRKDWLSDYEKKWLETPLDQSRLDYYQQKFGSHTLRSLIRADREIGIGLVSGGRYAQTPLVKMCNEDPQARWRYIVGMLDYLYETFERDKPDFVFTYCVAFAPALAMYLVAKDLGILFLQPMPAKIDHMYVFNHCVDGKLAQAKRTFDIAKEDPSVVEAYRADAKAYLEKIRNKFDKHTYIDLMNKVSYKQGTLLGMFKTMAVDMARWGAIALGMMGTKGVIRQRKGWSILQENLAVFWGSRKTNKGRIFTDLNLDDVGPFIFYTLHVDPEASTMVYADQYTDQLKVIESIATNMPAGMKLVVKEHIPCLGKRPKGYYERIKAIPDVVLISPYHNSDEIIKRASLIYTITGTVGMEAIIIGKPVVVIGNTHYTDIGEGFVFCPTLEGTEKAISDALNLPNASEETLELYFASIFKENVPFGIELWINPEAPADRSTSEIAVKKITEFLDYHKQHDCYKS